jgi:hypothetical protein
MDKSTSYINITDNAEIHINEKSNNQTNKRSLQWVTTTISNAERNFVGTYQKINKKTPLDVPERVYIQVQ